MAAKVFCLASAKGGSGKTILAANFAKFLSGIGKKCLMVDCDAATHGMTLLYIAEVTSNSDPKRKGVFDYSGMDKPSSDLIADSIIEIEDGVHLLPATYRFNIASHLEVELAARVLGNILNNTRPSYDYIFLDAQAGSDAYSRLVMNTRISDEVIIVSEYDPLSAAGVERLKQVVGDALSYQRTWILLNKMLPEFIERFSEFLSVAKYLPPIPWDAEVVRAYAKRRLALDLNKGNEFTLAIMRTLSSLLGENIEDDLISWSEGRAYELKEPLRRQMSDVMQELEFLLENRRTVEQRSKLRKLLLSYSLVMLSALAVTATGSFYGMASWREFFILEPVFRPVGIVAMFVTAMSVLFWATTRLFRSDRTAESVTYDVRIGVLEERLRKLAILRDSDLETIVKNTDT